LRNGLPAAHTVKDEREASTRIHLFTENGHVTACTRFNDCLASFITWRYHIIRTKTERNFCLMRSLDLSYDFTLVTSGT
jgi:hypothetical protein